MRFWHIPPPDRQSRRCYLRHDRHNFDVADGSPFEFADAALGRAGHFHWDLLHFGRFAAAGLCGGFSGEAHSSGIPQRRGHPHFSQSNWRGLWLSDEGARDSVVASDHGTCRCKLGMPHVVTRLQCGGQRSNLRPLVCACALETDVMERGISVTVMSVVKIREKRMRKLVVSLLLKTFAKTQLQGKQSPVS